MSYNIKTVLYCRKIQDKNSNYRKYVKRKKRKNLNIKFKKFYCKSDLRKSKKLKMRKKKEGHIY